MRVPANRRLVGEAVPYDEEVGVELLREVEVEALRAVTHRAALLELAHLRGASGWGCRLARGLALELTLRLGVGAGVGVSGFGCRVQGQGQGRGAGDP